jgi:integrase
MPSATIALHPSAIDAVKPGKIRRVFSFHDSTDKRIQGLRLFVTPAGGKTFYYQYTDNTAGTRITQSIRIEEFKPHHFAEAQRGRVLDKVNELKLSREGGSPPKAEYRERQREAAKKARVEREAAHRPTLKSITDEYFAFVSDPKSGRYKKTWREGKRLIEKDILPSLGSRIAEDITRDDFRDALRGIVHRGNIMANRTQAVTGTLLAWAADEGIVPYNVLRGMRKIGGAEKSRDRDLSEPEIKIFWHGIEATYCPTYSIKSVEKTDPPIPVMSEENAIALKLLLLTGCRRAEVAGAEWKEVSWKRRVWEIPGSKTKAGTAMVVPLTSETTALLKRLQKLTGGTPYWIPRRRKIGNGFAYTSKPTRPENLSHALLNARRRGAFGGAEAFTVHDLRRTLRTLITTLGISRDIAERLLNHQVGDRVERTYDRYSYLDEKRDALSRWGRYIVDLASEGAGIVGIQRLEREISKNNGERIWFDDAKSNEDEDILRELKEGGWDKPLEEHKAECERLQNVMRVTKGRGTEWARSKSSSAMEKLSNEFALPTAEGRQRRKVQMRKASKQKQITAKKKWDEVSREAEKVRKDWIAQGKIKHAKTKNSVAQEVKERLRLSDSIDGITRHI